MGENIIFFIITLGCASLFYCIGIYASKKEEPMSFYSGVEVKTNEITNIKQYNKENAKMWKLFSLWFFISAFLSLFNIMLSSIFLVLGCTLGIIILVRTYTKICEKYHTH